MSRLHVTLVTGRAEANLIPILQLQPEKVYLVASQRMLEPGKRLEKLLKAQLPGTVVVLRQGLPDTDPEAIGNFAIKLADELETCRDASPELAITYDMTGGSKLMGLLFQEAMRLCGAEIMYTDSDAGALYQLGTDLKPESFYTIPIEPVLNTDLYLRLNDKRLCQSLSDDQSWRDRAHQRKALTKHLGRNAEALTSLFGDLNYLIHVSDKSKQPVILKGDQQTKNSLNPAGWEQWLNKPPAKPCREALEKMAEAEVLEWSSSAPCMLRFNTLEGAEYLSGGWLEEYAWHCARDAGLDDVYCGAQVIDLFASKDDIRNEFDLVAVHRNRMLLIECKTGRMDNQGPDQQVLHKLHSLSEQSSGLFGTKVLLSAQPFGNADNHKRNIKRAASMQVQVLDGAALKALPDKLSAWIKDGHWPR